MDIVVFVQKAFRKFFGVSLWLVLISCPIFFAISFSHFGYGAQAFLFAILGLILGAVIGVFIIIIYGGLIATFLEMEATFNKMTVLLQKIAKVEDKGTPDAKSDDAGAGASTGAGE